MLGRRERETANDTAAAAAAAAAMSFVNVSPHSDFSYDNLPYGVFSVDEDGGKAGGRRRIGVAIGDSVLDLSVVAHLFDGTLMKEQQVRSVTLTANCQAKSPPSWP